VSHAAAPIAAFTLFGTVRGRARRGLIAAIVLLAILWFGGLEYRGLFQPDEGRYAEIAREMLVSGDWITPRLNGLKYFEKPPLQYWATAVSFALFGEDEWTARLWTAVSGFLGLLFVVFAGNRVGPPGAGSIAGLVLASSCAYFLSSQYLTLDMGLTFFMSAALLAFLLAHQGAPPVKRGWMLLAWSAMAGAVLTKGLVGIVLPGMVLAVYVLMQRDWRLLRELEWGRGLALFAALALPWFIAVQMRNPEFFDFFVLHEHFARYALAGHNRPGAWWYFGVVLLAGTMPWTPALAAVVRRALSSREPSRLDVERLLLVWIGVLLVFFSFSKSKLPAYILPALPALALLMGRDVARRARLDMKWPALFGAAAGAASLALVLPQITSSQQLADDAIAYVPWFLAGSMTLAACGLAAWWLSERRAALSLLVLSFGSVACLQLVLSGLYQVDENYSTEKFAEQFLGEDKDFAPELPFYSVDHFDPSLAFYLGRTLTLVSYYGELAPGIAAEPDRFVPTLEQFKQRWIDSEQAYAAMTPHMYERLRAERLPMRMLATDRRRVIVSREGADPPLLDKPEGKLMSLARRGRRAVSGSAS
jgi:4-amino-4-deoxy-L-arabinose transferase-like glycosyltransferase